jgi:hypothetical protein
LTTTSRKAAFNTQFGKTKKSERILRKLGSLKLTKNKSLKKTGNIITLVIPTSTSQTTIPFTVFTKTNLSAGLELKTAGFIEIINQSSFQSHPPKHLKATPTKKGPSLPS